MKKRPFTRILIGLFLIILLGSQSIRSSVVFAESNNSTNKELNSIYLEVGSRHALVYGQMKQMTSLPVVENGTTLVPLRFVSEQLGAKVSWEEETQQIKLEKGSNTIVLHLGSDQMLVNGTAKTLSLAPRTIDDRTFVPLRAISESFGKTVFYENDLIGISDESAALQIGFEDDFKSKLLARLAPQVINMNYSMEPYTLDSTYAIATLDASIINLFHEGLYRLNEENQATPALAKSQPTVSADGLTYTISLREGIVWSDGLPIAAQDFVYAVNRTKSLPDAPVAYIIDKIDTITAPNDSTLVIKLVNPYPQFTQMLTMSCFFPQRQDVVEAFGGEYGSESDYVIGAGPFMLDSWEHFGRMTFVKNDRYWDADNVQLDQVIVHNTQYQADSVELYKQGKFDLIWVGGDFIPLLKNDPDFHTRPDLVSAYIEFQESKVPAFANKKIRQAFSLAINKEDLVRKVLLSGKAADGVVPDGTSDGNGGEFRTTAGPAAGYDPDKAKQLLQEGLQELGLREMPSFTLTTDSTSLASRTSSLIISQWKSVLGVEVLANPVPFQLRLSLQEDHDFEAAVNLWGADYNDPINFLEIFTTSNNDMDYTNSNYDKLISEANAETDSAKRTKLLVEAEKQLMNDMPIAPLYFREQTFLLNPAVKGMFIPAFGYNWEMRWASKGHE